MAPEALSSACPGCGAITAMTGDGARCMRCGTAVPPTHVSWFQHHAKLVYLGLFVAAAAAVIVPALLAGGDDAPATPAKPQAPVAPPESEPDRTARAAEASIDRYWETTRPVFVDVDGDSIPDLVGTVRYAIHRDELRLAAHSGKDGHLLWESDSLGPKVAVEQETLARVDGVIVWGSTYTALIAGFDVKTGKLLWKFAPDEVLDYYCRVDDQFVLVLKDKSQLALDRATGTLSKLSNPIDCHVTTRQGSDAAISDFRIEDMNIYQHYVDADGVIFTGSKAAGTEVAMLAASRNGTLSWRVNLAARSPLTARRPTSSAPDFDRDIVAEPIQDGDNASLEVFDRATGKRELDVPIKTNPRLPIMSIATIVAKAAIYVVVQDDLQAYSRTTGALLWHLRR